MRCDFCKSYTGKFKTQQEYMNFEYKLNQLIKEGGLKFLGSTCEEPYFSASEYQCTKCESIWALVVPAQAYREGTTNYH